MKDDNIVLECVVQVSVAMDFQCKPTRGFVPTPGTIPELVGLEDEGFLPLRLFPMPRPPFLTQAKGILLSAL